MTKVYFQTPKYKEFKKQGITGVDMHFHTEYSMDGISKVEYALRKCRNLGIGMTVSDHNEIKGVKKAERLKKKVFFVPGVEITSKVGSHILFYSTHASNLIDFFDKEIKPLKKKNPFFIQKSFSELLEMGKENGFFISAPHPFGAGITGVKNSGEKFNARKLDFIEGINGVCFRGMNKQAISWAKKLNKPMTAGTDAHMTSEMGKTLCFANTDSLEEFFRSIKKGNNIITGKEVNLFTDILDQMEKFIREGEKEGKKKTIELYKSRIGTEYPFFKAKYMKMKDHMKMYYLLHHYNTKKEGEHPVKKHHLEWIKKHKHFKHLVKHEAVNPSRR